MAPNPDELLEIPFSEPFPGQSGYRARDVDPLMKRAVDAMKGSDDIGIFHDLHSVPLTPTRNWLVRRYREDQVDAMLELCAYAVAEFRSTELNSYSCPQCSAILATKK